MSKRVFLLMVFVVSICFLMTGCGVASQINADNLAIYAKEQFMENDCEQYLQELREACGLSDLNIVPNMRYTLEYDYDKKNKTKSDRNKMHPAKKYRLTICRTTFKQIV